MSRRKSKNKKSFKLFLLLAIFLVAGIVIFNIQKEDDLYAANQLDLKLAQYSDSNITQNAVVQNPKLSQIAFNPIPAKEKLFYQDQIAGVGRALSFLLVGRDKNEKEEYGTWIWTPTLQMSDDYMESVLDDAEAEGVNVIYLSIDSYLDIYTLPDGTIKKEKEKLFSQTLEKFIKMAKERNIEVDAEGGWRNWAEPGHTYKAFAVVDYVKNFNILHEDKFRGFQYDVEPYLLDDYARDEESKKVILQNFVKLVDETSHFLGESDLHFSVVVPDFYDRKDKVTPRFSYAGRRDYVFGHLLEILESREDSSLVIMSYRNFADGQDGSIDVSENEMKTGNKWRYSTRLVIAEETSEVLPSYITFHNTSKEYFLTESQKLRTAFDSYSNFSGLAVHYANAFLSLK